MAELLDIPFYDLAAEHAGLRGDLDRAYARVMGSGQFILGPELAAFERAFAQCCGTGEAVGVGNGLDALALSLRALGIGPGDEVIVAAHTFVATWLAIVQVGAVPVACEPDAGCFFISAEGVEPLLTPRTRAVIAVHMYGIPAPVHRLAALCRAHGVHLVEDAAQAHGALEGGARCGAVGVLGCFSFYPSKNLGALGDGGAIVTADAGLADQLRRLRNYGGLGKYDVGIEGSNSRLDEMQAAWLRVKLGHLERVCALRADVAALYQRELADQHAVVLPTVSPGDQAAWHLFPICVERRDQLQAYLADRGIQTAIHYPVPVYRMAPFKRYGPLSSTRSDRLSATLLSLPFWPSMPEEAVRRVCDAIRAFFVNP